MLRKNLAIAALLLGVGGAGGYLLSPRAAPTPAPSQGRSDAAPARPAAAASPGLTEADVRRVIRDELAALPAPSAPAGASGEAKPDGDDAPAPPLSPAAESALLTARDRIDRALVAKVWTQSDAATLTAALEILPPAQRDELLHTLVPAFNRGEIRLAYQGPLFE